MNTGQWVVIGLSGFLFAWYLFWNIFNRRRGIATYYWLRRFMERTGEILEAGWLGSSSSGARITVKHGKKPFRQVEATALIENRDILPLWVLHALQGRREECVLRASLQPTPKLTVEVGKIGDKEFDKMLAQAGNTVSVQSLSDGYRVAWLPDQPTPDINPLQDFLESSKGALQRITLRKESPHLEIHARLKPLISLSPDSFFEALLVWLNSL